MNIRPANSNDVDGIWEIFKYVIATGDTYVFAPDTPKSEFEKYWFATYIKTFVAEEEGQIVGSYIIKANQPDLGNHIANGSYIVSPLYQGKGIGKQLCEHSLQIAKILGFYAMQFNIVVSSNKPAVHLWQKCGFRIVGIVPKAFRHQQLGLVDTFVMYREI